eukprot:286780_1
MADDEVMDTFKALDALLKDEESFQTVVKAVFKIIDKDESGTIEQNEIEEFISTVCKEMNIGSTPDKDSIQSVFKELDEDHSNTIDEAELGKFLKTLFTEQKNQCETNLKEKG